MSHQYCTTESHVFDDSRQTPDVVHPMDGDYWELVAVTFLPTESKIMGEHPGRLLWTWRWKQP